MIAGSKTKSSAPIGGEASLKGGGWARQASRCHDQSCCCWEASLRRAMRASAAAAICSLLLLASCSDLDRAGALLAFPCLLLQRPAAQRTFEIGGSCRSEDDWQTCTGIEIAQKECECTGVVGDCY